MGALDEFAIRKLLLYGSDRDAAATRFTTALPEREHGINGLPDSRIGMIVKIIFFTKVFGVRNRFCLYLAEKVNANVGRN